MYDYACICVLIYVQMETSIMHIPLQIDYILPSFKKVKYIVYIYSGNATNIATAVAQLKTFSCAKN